MGPDEIEQIARAVAREELASFSGLVLRRLQDEPDDAMQAPIAVRLAGIFGEALRDFGATPDEPGK